MNLHQLEYSCYHLVVWHLLEIVFRFFKDFVHIGNTTGQNVVYAIVTAMFTHVFC